MTTTRQPKEFKSVYLTLSNGRRITPCLVACSFAGGYFGVITQGFPQLVRVNGDVVKHDPSRAFPERGPILCQVRMLNESPLIPDFECLEQMISEETRAS